MDNDGHSLTVRIRYLLVSESTWRERLISPADYVDPGDLDKPGLDSVPREAHAIDFLRLPPDLVRRTELEVKDSRGNSRHVSETFWHGGRSRAIEVTDSRTRSWELILDITTEEAPEVEHILRYGRVHLKSALISHSRILRLPDGSEQEDLLYSLVSDPMLRDALDQVPADPEAEP